MFRRDRRRVQTLQSGGRPVNHLAADTTTGAVDRNDNPTDTDSWPLDARPALALALVARVTRQVDEACNDRRDLLLEDLMCAAWPTSLTQDQ